MCGITGLMAFNEVGRIQLVRLEEATRQLSRRGPDYQGTFFDHRVGLGHRRLSILDTSAQAHQPMHDPTGRYTLIFNGEVFNFLQIKQELSQKGISFQSTGDTEVLLHALIVWGKQAISKLNGFFAFAFYDHARETLLLARDRMGIKPLLYFRDEDKFIFASEMKAMLAFSIDRKINQTALFTYFQLNYTPAPLTMIEGIRKLMPGQLIEVSKGAFSIETYYEIPQPQEIITDYGQAKELLQQKLEDSVKLRLVADVPIGAFLSGGIDSSVITALASKHTDQLNTFSIGFKDQPYFDETSYAQLVAKKFNTQHHEFSLTTADMLGAVDDILGYFDEPFADSSAIPVYILSRETAKIAKVALSGDGADELFAGYHKHAGWLKSLSGSAASRAVTLLHPLWEQLPQSRSAKLPNLFRQLNRFAKGMKLGPADRYWFWASISSPEVVQGWLKEAWVETEAYHEMRSDYLRLMNQPTVGNFLHTDARLVLPNDMLTKVDLMSMANGLEVRVPFLDHRLVSFAFQLPAEFKINPAMKKRIVQDAFRDILPQELYNRPKHGFEVPLLSWFRKELRGKLDEILFDRKYLEQQGLFDPSAIMHLRKKINAQNSGDSAAQVWALFVFQHWYRRYITPAS